MSELTPYFKSLAFSLHFFFLPNCIVILQQLKQFYIPYTLTLPSLASSPYTLPLHPLLTLFLYFLPLFISVVSLYKIAFAIFLISPLNFTFYIFFFSCVLSPVITSYLIFLSIIVYSCLFFSNLVYYHLTQHEESNRQCCQALHTAGHYIPQHTPRTRTPYFRHTGIIPYQTVLYRIIPYYGTAITFLSAVKMFAQMDIPLCHRSFS